jgi:uncharacterized protein YecT (DUF1311 family)
MNQYVGTWQGVLLFVGLMLFTKEAMALDCQKATTQRGIEKCVQNEVEVANQTLEATYKHYLAIRSGKDRELLRSAQEAWERYRETNCRASAAIFAGGSLESTEFVACKLHLTQERLVELKRIYEEPPFPPKQ